MKVQSQTDKSSTNKNELTSGTKFRWSNNWIQEILALFTSAILLIALSFFLSKFNDNLAPSFKYNIRLSTIAAIFSTLFRSFIISAIKNVIGQAKWIWFQNSRAAVHLDIFDQASRGPWGSLRLVFSIRRQFVGIIASVITLLSFAIGPFIQQTLRPIACEIRMNSSIEHPSASFPVANWFNGSFWAIDNGLAAVDSGTMISASNALVNPNTNIDLPFSCLTGNCTFPTVNGISYSSVGYCSKCFSNIDAISTGFNFDPNSNGGDLFITLQLPNNISVLGWATTALNITALTSDTSNIDWAIDNTQDYSIIAAASDANITILSLTQNTCVKLHNGNKTTMNCPPNKFNLTGESSTADVIASTCLIYRCAKDCTAIIQKRILKENIVSSYPIPGDFVTTDMQRILKLPCVVNSKWYDYSNITAAVTGNLTQTILMGDNNITVPEQCVFGASRLGSLGTASLLQDLFQGNCNGSEVKSRKAGYLSLPGFCHRGQSGQGNMTADLVRSPWIEELYKNGNATFDSISQQMDAVATALTNRLRVMGTDWNGNKMTAAGTAIEFAVCVQFHWRWLLFPAGILFLTAVLLLFIMLPELLSSKTSQYQPLWKTSILPLIFYAVGSKIRSNDIDIPLETAELKRMADNQIIRIGSSMEGWGFIEDQSSIRKRH